MTGPREMPQAPLDEAFDPYAYSPEYDNSSEREHDEAAWGEPANDLAEHHDYADGDDPADEPSR